MLFMPIRFVAVALLLLFSLFCSGCTSKPAEKRLRVVASIEPLAYFAQRIGGGYVTVSVMVPSGGNPHTYEPTPKQMSRLGAAKLFVKAGSGVEFELDLMQKIVSMYPGLRICDASSGIQMQPAGHENGVQGEVHDAEEHHHGRFDPHYWLSPQNALVIAENVKRSLAEADPGHSAYYQANADRLKEELRELSSELHVKLAQVVNRRFLVFHPAWGYYASDFALQQIAAEEEGKTLTPRQLERVIQKARANRIRVVFVSPQFSTVQAETIAREIGGVTRPVDPLAFDYQENLRRATDAFKGGMQ
ncbi:MAG: zinc ABC transporter solute-binding protein [Chlorobiaceae bacterium]|nr:zinc ABC transporter solute-binding protein [Chlorobiaceae bacterium]